MKSSRDAHEHRRQGHQGQRRIRQPNTPVVAPVSSIEKVKNTTQLIGVSSRAGMASKATATRLSSSFCEAQEPYWARLGCGKLVAFTNNSVRSDQLKKII
ncbi:hypothetical protein POK33_08930 [Burkholderia cenocepacia]|uniref:hypothetical protein n=1 Tax=Burkholderia cenocepacia TaxID=95486 RepID=UPI0023B9BBC8|nr:hypothetical protein [Burkholderia cenocepacia]MDF0500853.1 hypothetical protein [Burkholderia cenocepacia]